VTTLIIPGLNGSGPGHWQSWWLAEDGDAILVEQDDWRNPRPGAWQSRLADAIAAAPGATLIAHSLGCALVAQLARIWPEAPIGGALLVAPADVEDGRWATAELAAFGPLPVRAFPFKSTLVASRNDPYMAFDRSAQLARAWGSTFVDLGASGHINAESGFGPWPRGLDLAARLSGPSGLARPAFAPTPARLGKGA